MSILLAKIVINSTKELYREKPDEYEKNKNNEKAIMDEKAIEKAGFRKGKEAGIEQGQRQGEEQKTKQIIAKLKQKGFSEEEIIKMLDLNEEELK